MLSNRWLKDYVRTAENYQMFHILFKNIRHKIVTKFLTPLVLSPALEKFVCIKPNQKYPNMLKYYSICCSLANCDTKYPIVMQIRLVARSALSGY